MHGATAAAASPMHACCVSATRLVHLHRYMLPGQASTTSQPHPSPRWAGGSPGRRLSRTAHSPARRCSMRGVNERALHTLSGRRACQLQPCAAITGTRMPPDVEQQRKLAKGTQTGTSRFLREHKVHGVGILGHLDGGLSRERGRQGGAVWRCVKPAVATPTPTRLHHLHAGASRPPAWAQTCYIRMTVGAAASRPCHAMSDNVM